MDLSANRLGYPNEHIRAVKVMDPRLCLEQNRDYVVLRGCQVNNCMQFPASNLSNTTVQITANPPNTGIAVSRLIFKRFRFQITISGTNTSGGPLLNAGFHGPRAYPLLAATGSESITIQNSTISISPVRQFMPYLMCYHNDFKHRNGQSSLTPSMLDQFPANQNGYNLPVGALRNPLLTYLTGSPYEEPRGAYVGYQVVFNPPAGTQAIVELEVIEPIFISPLVWDKHSNFTSALVGVENMSYQCQWGDLTRLLSLSIDQGQGANITINPAFDVEVQEAQLLFNLLTPSSLEFLPRSLTSSYFSPVCYPTVRNQTASPTDSFPITMQAVQLNSIPRRIYIFCRDQDQSLTPFTPDTVLPLSGNTPLTVLWGNQQFCSGWTQADIYNVAAKNGYGYTYSQFSQQMGAVICLDLAVDIGLPSDQAPSLLGNEMLQITCNFYNNTNRVIVNPTMYCVVVSEGTFTIVNGAASISIGVLSRSQIINALPDPHVTFKSSEDIYGGSFFSKLKGALSGLNNFAKKHKIVSKGLALTGDPRLALLGKAASSFGYGSRGRRMRGGNLDEDEEVKVKKTKRELTPKRKSTLSKSEIKARLIRGKKLDEGYHSYDDSQDN